MTSLQPKKNNFPPFSARERLRNGWGTSIVTAEKRSSVRLAHLLLLVVVVMNDRGKSHSHRARHRGE
jgi:hypothetical protein